MYDRVKQEVYSSLKEWPQSRLLSFRSGIRLNDIRYIGC